MSRSCVWRKADRRHFADRVFFCNSGAEANEAALKLARKYAHDRLAARKAASSRSKMPSTAARCLPFRGRSAGLPGFCPAAAADPACRFNDLESAKALINDKPAR
jgi:succinylornithine aminotransferase